MGGCVPVGLQVPAAGATGMQAPTGTYSITEDTWGTIEAHYHSLLNVFDGGWRGSNVGQRVCSKSGGVGWEVPFASAAVNSGVDFAMNWMVTTITSPGTMVPGTSNIKLGKSWDGLGTDLPAMGDANQNVGWVGAQPSNIAQPASTYAPFANMSAQDLSACTPWIPVYHVVGSADLRPFDVWQSTADPVHWYQTDNAVWRFTSDGTGTTADPYLQSSGRRW